MPNVKIFSLRRQRLQALLQVFLLLLGELVYTTATSETGNGNTSGVFIVRAPESAVAPKGDEVVFECELNLTPDRLEWRFRLGSHTYTTAGSENNSNRYRYVPLNEENNNITTEDTVSKLRIYVVPETLGDYQCVAWFGPTAIASNSARLTLVSITIDNSNGYSRNAVRWSVAPKNCILIRCGTVTSNPPAIWSFYRNGEKVLQSEVLPTSSGGGLILNSVSTKDSGNYTCSAMNAITGVELKLPQSIDLRVEYAERTPPYFLVQRQPAQVSARPGESIVLECPGVGSPKPEAVWSSPNIVSIYNNRTKILAYGLQIVDVRPEDQGSYVCRLDNGIAPVLVHMIKLNVLGRPNILQGPINTLTNEGESLELECSASGNPQPAIYWLINGDDTRTFNGTYAEGGRLVISHVQKRHAGIVQCFAKNSVGEASEANLLRVNPKEIQGDLSTMPLGNVPIRPFYDHSDGGRGDGTGKSNKGKRKHMRIANMVPPSRPNVTRLSDDSVMLRWNVPKNEGLPIQFFKVQYRMLGDSARKVPRGNWQTTNEDIPYGKREHNYGDSVKNFTSSVTALKPDRLYRFRIIAVYSNNDNKEGNISAKFFLQRGSALGLAKENLPVPELAKIEALSENAIMLHWTTISALQTQEQNSSMHFDGFYAYYRPSSSAGDYLKATVDGMHARSYKIDMLEPGTAYEFKLQSFNANAASEFSGIRQGRTKRIHTTVTPTAPVVITTMQANQEDNSIYPVVAGAAGGGLLLLIATIGACLCMKRRKQSQSEDEDKPQLEHIQADFVTSAVLGVTTHHKAGLGHRLNGVIPRMNITANPLAQDGTVKSTLHHHQQHQQHQFYAQTPQHQHQQCQEHGQLSGHSQPYQQQSTHTSAAGTPTMLLKRDYHQQPPPVPPHRNQWHMTLNNNNNIVNQHYIQQQQQHQSHGHNQLLQSDVPAGVGTVVVTAASSPTLDYQRRTLERNIRNLQQTPQAQMQQQPPQQLGYHYYAAPPAAPATQDDSLPTLIPSLRRTRRTSNMQNNSTAGMVVGLPMGNGGGAGMVGIPIVPGSPRVQRSPMPAHAMIKRTRLGSHSDNISSGSLNSIEV